MSEVVNILRTNFNLGKTRSYDYRVKQLNALKRIILENEESLCTALYQDLHKNKYETLPTTIAIVLKELNCALANLKKWMQPEYVTKNWVQSLNSAYTIREPYGLVLIIGPWNYPIQLNLIPLIGVIAAGNVALLKLSPFSVATTKLFVKLIPQYLDSNCYVVMEGDADWTAKFISENRFDHIMYTGGSGAAKQIMMAAAKNLTPLTLELGGKSPAILLSDADLVLSAKRILWGKFSNCGQTCIAPDYVITTSTKATLTFVNAAKEILHQFYGADPKDSDSYGRIINKHHFDRILGLLKDCQIAFGGASNESELYIQPTIVTDVHLEHPIMQEEIFGPILPIVEIDGADKIISFTNSREKPLAIYLFTNDTQSQNRFQTETSSGAFSINDVIMHYTYETLPFGGVGYSGMGRYHGKFSFDQFSHLKACINNALWSEKINELRYPPFTETKSKWLSYLMGK